jgi:hypothetical protein
MSGGGRGGGGFTYGKGTSQENPNRPKQWPRAGGPGTVPSNKYMLETIDQIAARQDHTGRVVWRWLHAIGQSGSVEEQKANKTLSIALRSHYLSNLTPAEKLSEAWADDVRDNFIAI